MGEIQVGEYVRINNDFRLIALGIGKVVKINKDSIYVKNNFELPFTFKKENIAKHSFNNIDLIEKDDYINGCRVYEVEKNGITVYQKVENSSIDYNWIAKDEIKTILTHEQYENNCYRIGE